MVLWGFPSKCCPEILSYLLPPSGSGREHLPLASSPPGGSWLVPPGAEVEGYGCLKPDPFTCENPSSLWRGAAPGYYCTPFLWGQVYKVLEPHLDLTACPIGQGSFKRIPAQEGSTPAWGDPYWESLECFPRGRFYGTNAQPAKGSPVEAPSRESSWLCPWERECAFKICQVQEWESHQRTVRSMGKFSSLLTLPVPPTWTLNRSYAVAVGREVGKQEGRKAKGNSFSKADGPSTADCGWWGKGERPHLWEKKEVCACPLCHTCSFLNQDWYWVGVIKLFKNGRKMLLDCFCFYPG